MNKLTLEDIKPEMIKYINGEVGFIDLGSGWTIDQCCNPQGNFVLVVSYNNKICYRSKEYADLMEPHQILAEIPAALDFYNKKVAA